MRKKLRRPKRKPGKQKNVTVPKVTLHKLDWLEWASIASGIWLLVYPYPYRLVFTIVLIIPILGLILNGVSKPSLASLVSLSFAKGQRDYDLADFIELPGLFLAVRVLLDFEFESFFSILKVGTVGFVLMLILLGITHKDLDKKHHHQGLIYLVVVGNIALYSYAATYGVNCVYDISRPEVYNAKVIKKSVSGGKRTRYYLKVEPWGHHNDPERISVSKEKYYATEEGKTVTIGYKEGLLGIPWYYIER